MSSRRKRAASAVQSAVEALESRQLLTTFIVNTAADLAAVNNTDLEPGDVVAFQGGTTISGSFSLGTEDSGTADNPVVVTSYDPATGLLIDPSAPVAARATLNSGNASGVVGTNVFGVKLIGLNIVGSGRTVNTGSGVSFENTQAGNTKLSGLTIDHVDVSGYKMFGITVGGNAGRSGYSNVDITNVHVYDIGHGGIETHGVWDPSSPIYANTDVYVGYSVVHGVTGIAGWNNHSGDGIVLSDVDGAVIEHSEAYDNGAFNTHVGGPVGIWAWRANAVTIQYNESHHNKTNSRADGGGFDLDGGITNSVMQYNYSHDNAGAGFGIYQFGGAPDFRNVTVRYNISENDGRKNDYSGIHIWNGGTTAFEDIFIYGNTVKIAKATGSTSALRLQNDGKNVKIFNNVFVTTAGALSVWVQPRSTPGTTVVGNDYWAVGSTVTFKLGAKIKTGFSSWTAAGYETLNGVVVGKNVDPRFVSLAGGSAAAFQLQSTSPLINAGINPFSVFGIQPGDRDYFGDAIPQGAGYDIGADEVLM